MSKNVPDLEGKVNAVLRFIHNPCQTPWYIYLETMKEPARNLMLGLLLFGMDDVIRGYYRPKGLRSRPHMRSGKRFKPRGPGIPEIGESIGKSLWGADDLAQRQVSQGVKYLWIIDGVVQRVLWYFLIVDLVSDFFFEWTTAIMETSYCQRQSARSCAYDGHVGSSHALFGWNALGFPDLVYSQNGLTYQNIFGSLPGPGYHVVATSRVRNPHNVIQQYEIAIFSGAGFGNQLATSGIIEIAPNSDGEAVVTYDSTGVVGIQTYERNSFSAVHTIETNIFIMEWTKIAS